MNNPGGYCLLDVKNATEAGINVRGVYQKMTAAYRSGKLIIVSNFAPSPITMWVTNVETEEVEIEGENVNFEKYTLGVLITTEDGKRYENSLTIRYNDEVKLVKEEIASGGGSDLPDITGKIGKYLKVIAGTDDVPELSWEDALPEATEDDAGKYLYVSDTGGHLVWREPITDAYYVRHESPQDMPAIVLTDEATAMIMATFPNFDMLLSIIGMSEETEGRCVIPSLKVNSSACMNVPQHSQYLTAPAFSRDSQTNELTVSFMVEGYLIIGTIDLTASGQGEGDTVFGTYTAVNLNSGGDITKISPYAVQYNTPQTTPTLQLTAGTVAATLNNAPETFFTDIEGSTTAVIPFLRISGITKPDGTRLLAVKVTPSLCKDSSGMYRMSFIVDDMLVIVTIDPSSYDPRRRFSGTYTTGTLTTT